MKITYLNYLIEKNKLIQIEHLDRVIKQTFGKEIHVKIPIGFMFGRSTIVVIFLILKLIEKYQGNQKQRLAHIHAYKRHVIKGHRRCH